MKGTNIYQRPKFPRPKRFKKIAWVLGGVICLFLAFFLLRSNANDDVSQKKDTSLVKRSEELHDKNRTTSEQKENITRKGASQQAQPVAKENMALEASSPQTSMAPTQKNSSQKTQDKDASFVMNLAGITAKKQQEITDEVQQKNLATTDPLKKLSRATNQKDLDALALKQNAAAFSEKASFGTKRTKTPVDKRAALPRSFDLPDQPPLFAAESTLWNQPFVGFSFEEIATILSEKYKGQSPKQWGEHIPGVTSKFESKSASPTVALTLDACGGKKGNGYDAGIIKLLRDKDIPATLFVTSTWVTAHRKEFTDLASDPLFEIAAHGATHKPLSVNGKSIYNIQGTASIKDVVIEVESNLREIHRLTRKRPKWFRSGTAYYDEIAVNIVNDLGLGVAGFSITGDEGATLPAKAVEKKVLSAQNGDIIVCHFNRPESGTREGLRAALPKLIEQGYTFVTLSQALEVQ